MAVERWRKRTGDGGFGAQKTTNPAFVSAAKLGGPVSLNTQSGPSSAERQTQAGLRPQSFALVGGENVALVSIGQNESCGCGFSYAPVCRHPVGLLELPDNEGLYK